MGAFPNLSRNVPFCLRLSSFVLFGARDGDKSGQKRSNGDKTGHFGPNWETPPFSIYPHLALLNLCKTHQRVPTKTPTRVLTRNLRVLTNVQENVPKAQATSVEVGAECTKIARFSAVAAAIFTAPPKNARFFEAPRCAISSAKKIASEPRFLLRRKWVKMVLTAEFPAIPSFAIKIASERRCAILVHSG